MGLVQLLKRAAFLTSAVLLQSPPPAHGGRVFAVGSNPSGQHGDQTRTDRAVLTEIEHALYFPPNNPSASVVQPLRNSIIQIAASSGDQVSDQQGYSLFLSSDGRVLASGRNPFFTLIQASTTTMPIYINSLGNDIVAIAAGRTHSLFLKRNGTVIGVGFNCCGQLGTSLDKDTYSITPTRVPISQAVVQMDTNQAGFHSVFVTAGGQVLASGQNSDGQLGSGTLTNSYNPIPMLDTSSSGTNPLANIKMAVAGVRHTVMLSEGSGLVYTVGANNHGQLGDGRKTGRQRAVRVSASQIVHIAAGESHTLLVARDGKVYVHGSNGHGQLGSGGPTVGAASDSTRPTQLLDRWNSPMNPRTHPVTHVSAGSKTSFFRTSSGDVFAAGSDWANQLGASSSAAYHTLPTAVNTHGIKIGTVAAGGSHSLFLALDCENEPMPCQNQAACSNWVEDQTRSRFSFSCACTAGYTNGICDYDFIPEASASCNVTKEGMCDVDLDECMSNPCLHGACDDSKSCQDKQTAFITAEELRPAADRETYVPEENCKSSIPEDSYKCFCEDLGLLGGWKGANCDEEIPPSLPFFIVVGTLGLVALIAVLFGCLVIHIRRKDAKAAGKAKMKLNRVAPAP